MAAPRITFGVGPRTGTAPTQPVAQYSNATLKMNLRTGPELGWSMPGNSAAALQTSGLATDVWVYKAGNASPFRRLRVLPVEQSWDDNGASDAVVTSVGYQRLVEGRYIIALQPTTNGVPVFSAVDQGSIVWQLIQHTQAQSGGDLGITAGSYTTGQVRDRADYKIGDSIGTLASNLGDVVNGMWWGIDAAKVYTAKLWTAFSTRTDPIAMGTNARKLSRKRGRSFANAAGAVGDAALTVPSWQLSAGIATDPRGRWESFDSSHSDVRVQATVVDYATGNLAAALVPPNLWTIILDPASYFEGSSNYAEGDIVPIVVPADVVDELTVPAVSVLAQITEVVITFDDIGGASVTMTAIEVG